MRPAFLHATPTWLVLLAGTLLAMGASAQSDPTRPPPAWLAGQQPVAPGAEAQSAEPTNPSAQIVVLSESRKFVVVNGQAIHLGESYNGARLVAIHRDGIVWRRDGVSEKAGANPAKSKKKTATGEVQ